MRLTFEGRITKQQNGSRHNNKLTDIVVGNQGKYPGSYANFICTREITYRADRGEYKNKNQEKQQNHTNRSEILIYLKQHDFYRPTHHTSVSFHIEPKTA